MSLKIQHDLSKLNDAEVEQYLRDVSEYIGLDPDLHGLDTIWMENENGPGKSKVVYARRGTAEILREKHGISISSLANNQIGGSVVFTADGTNKDGRKEIAVGSKSIYGLNGKALDDAIMTASTRALRRVTMQFTKLGILDVSEVEAVVGSLVNPAAGATLAGSHVVLPPPPPPPNPAPGRDVTPVPTTVTNAPSLATVPATVIIQADTPPQNFATNSDEMIKEAHQQLAEKAAAPKRRKKVNTVSFGDVEPEIVNNTPAPLPEPVAPVQIAEPVAPPISVPVVGPDPVQSVAVPVAGMPTTEQMAEYRKKISVYTSELPSSENLGSVQKMRAFITKNTGTAPQFMTVDQWEEQLAWFESFTERNKVAGLVKYINDTLGVK